MLNIEIIYINSLQEHIYWQGLVPQNATVKEALEISGFLSRYPEIIHLKVGIFARLVSLDTQLRSGDRIELYRSLSLDPKEKRRQRAQKS